MPWPFAALAAALLAAAGAVSAATLHVVPGSDTLRRAIASAYPGDTLVLEAGRYGGGIVIDRSLTLTGSTKSIIDGGDSGRVITVAAPSFWLESVCVRP